MPLKTLPLHFITAFVTLVSAYACKKDNGQPSSSIDNYQDHNHYSFLALGDSYTIGQGVAENERFPAQTRGMLNAVGKQINDVQYIATTGWTTTDLQEAIAQQNPQGAFDIVTLLIGVNDQHHLHDTTGYNERFTSLAQKAIALTGNRNNHVFVLSIPDYSVTPFGMIDDTAQIRKEIDLFNSINYRVANELGVNYTDITPVSREALNDASLIANDHLHPSGKMYKEWADLLVQQIRQVLK
ncbi:MAG: GDSL-type esterase/lipase family protein [Agriterribacter sp.]